MEERAKDEVLAAYAAYVAAFRASNVETIDKLMQYPLAHIGDGQTTLLDTFPVKPAELMATKQWHDSKTSPMRWCSPLPTKPIFSCAKPRAFGQTDRPSRLSPSSMP